MPHSTTNPPLDIQPVQDSSAESPMPQVYRDHLTHQITKSLNLKRKEKENETDGAKRTQSTLAAWTGLSRNSDAVEAMLIAQMLLTQELTMTTIGIAASNSRGSRCLLSVDINNACKVARATLRQIETLARYRTWRRKTKAEERQQKLGELDVKGTP